MFIVNDDKNSLMIFYIVEFKYQCALLPCVLLLSYND